MKSFCTLLFLVYIGLFSANSQEMHLGLIEFDFGANINSTSSEIVICDQLCDEIVFCEVAHPENYIGSDFSFNWSHDGSVTHYFLDGCPGTTYHVEVLDSLGNEVAPEDIRIGHLGTFVFSDSIVIPESIMPVYDITPTPTNSSCSGSAGLNLISESLLTNISWENSSSDSAFASGLCFGWQEFTMETDYACLTTDSIFIPSNMSLSIQSVSSDTLCRGDCITVEYDVLNAWDNLVVNLELSNENGNFDNPTVLGTDENLTELFEVCIPEDIPYGNGYKLRAVAIDPAVSGLSSNFELVVLGFNTMGSIDDNGYCNGSATLSTSYNSSITSLNWTPSNQSDFTATDLCYGWHVATFETEQGCVISDSVYVEEVLPEITLESISTTTICEGSCFSVIYSSVGLPQEAEFKAELSDENGSFENPVLISGFNPFNSGTLNCCYLNNSPEGDHYRIRVKTVTEDEFSEDNGEDITIKYVDYEVYSAPGVLTATSDISDTYYQWLQCPFATMVENGESAEFTNGVNGEEYFVEVSQEGCTAYSLCVEFEGLDDGIQEASSLEFNMYPNPTSQNVLITANSLMTGIHIYDLGGRLVWQQSSLESSSFRCSLDALTNGLYIVEVHSSHGVMTSLLEILK